MIIESIYIEAFLGLSILALIYYIIVKDAQYTKKIRLLATAIENANRESYNVEKRILGQISELQTGLTTEHERDFGTELKSGIANASAPLAESVFEIEQSVHFLQEDLERRMILLENNMRTLSMPSPIQTMDNDKVIGLYQQGISVENIAKELRIPTPEVEFALKVKKLSK
jgi:hypothetical protein